MPIYEFVCKRCETETEKLLKMSDPNPKCEKCGEEMEKKVSQTSFSLKGSGWYKTDFKNKR